MSASSVVSAKVYGRRGIERHEKATGQIILLVDSGKERTEHALRFYGTHAAEQTTPIYTLSETTRRWVPAVTLSSSRLIYDIDEAYTLAAQWLGVIDGSGLVCHVDDVGDERFYADSNPLSRAA